MRQGMKAGLLLLVSFSFALGLAELALRVFRLETRYGANWVYHPVLGHTGPRSTIVKSGHDEATFNHTGFRDTPAVEISPLAAHPRLVVLGDSFTEAWQIYGRYIYTKHLERLLSLKSGLEYEVLAFAASDYGTAQELLAYDLYGHQYSPDLVVLQFFGLNDFLNNSLDFAFRNQGRSDFTRPYAIHYKETEKYPTYLERDGVPYTYLSGPGRIHAWIQPARRYLRLHSRLFALGESVLKMAEWKRLDAAGPPKCSAELEVFLKDPPAPWEKAIWATERLILSLKTVVRNTASPENLERKYFRGQRPELLGVYIPSLLEVRDHLWENTVVKEMAECHPGAELDRLGGEKKFFAAFTYAKAPSFSLREAFIRAEKNGLNLYLPDGHLTYEGHRIAAEAMRDFVLQEQKRLLGK